MPKDVVFLLQFICIMVGLDMAVPVGHIVSVVMAQSDIRSAT